MSEAPSVHSGETESPVGGGVIWDPLVDCLERVARWHGIEFSSEALLAGLPVEGGRLTPTLLIRAAGRIGLHARLVRRPLKKLPSSVLPAIVLLKDRCVGVLEPGPGGSGIELYEPENRHDEYAARHPAKSLKRRYGGYAILLRQSTGDGTDSADSAERSEYDFASAKSRSSWFWKTAWRFRSYYLRLLPASLLISLFAVTLPLFVMLVYDRVVPNDAKETLWVLAAGVAIVFVFEFIMRLMRGYVIERAGKEMDQVLASGLFEQVLAIEMSARPSSGSTLAGRMKAYETLRQFFMSASLLALADLPFGLLMIGVIFFIGGPVGWILVAASTLAIIVGFLIQFPMRSSVASSAKSSVERQGLISEAIGGLESVKGSRAEGRFQHSLEHLMASSAKHEVRSHWLGLVGTSTTAFLVHLTTVGIIVASVYRVHAGEMSMGAMIACVMLGARAMSPLAMVAGLMTRLQQSLASLHELNTVMALPRETGDGDHFLYRKSFQIHFQLNGVGVRYPGSVCKALSDVSLKIEPGDKIALLGRVGSGKSTLMRVLAKLYGIEEGEILLDGIDLEQHHPATVRQAIGYLPQDAVLFSGTMRDNIDLNGANLSDDVILRALNRAGLSEFVNHHPDGLHMQVGERGVLLSGGQRQAVALARALVGEPRLLLLDEPTGGIDVQSERHILSALRDYLAEDPTRTLIVSSHKMSALEIVDRIVILEGGHVVADGMKDAVLRKLKENGVAHHEPVGPGAKQQAG